MCQVNKGKAENLYSDLPVQIDSILDNQKFNGVILISSGSNTLYLKTFGFSDLESKTKLNFNDQFVIGSISKQITAVLVLREYEKGRIGLEDTINRYLTEISQPWTNEITIHHLLTHTHGITDIEQPLEFKPGSEFNYSQLGYELLAQILEKTTGKTFMALSTELFEEYNLSNTCHPDNKNYEHLVKGYEENEQGFLTETTNSLYNYAAAGSFISNANDLKKWNDLLYSGTLIRRETLKLMKTRYATRAHPIFGSVEYGYGLLFKDGKQDVEIGALGYAPGFVSACYHYPETNINLIVLQNTASHLDDFRQTFAVHTKMMELVKGL